MFTTEGEEAPYAFCVRCGMGFAKPRWHFIARRTPGDEIPSVWSAGRLDDPNIAERARYRWMWQARLVAWVRNRWTLKSRIATAEWWMKTGRFLPTDRAEASG